MRCGVCEVELRAMGCPNYWCGRDDRGFDAVWAVGRHEGRLRRAIAGLKYRAETRWAPLLGRLLAGYLLDRAPEFEDVGLITGVPGSPGRLDHVGAVLAAAEASLGGLWAVDAGMVVKQVPTRPLMATGSAGARRLWAAGELRPALRVAGPVAGRILVVDDVFTDGSTLREVAAALRSAGAARVSGLVLARQPLRAASGSPGGPSATGSM